MKIYKIIFPIKEGVEYHKLMSRYRENKTRDFGMFTKIRFNEKI